jgi:phosphoribosylglycinamide formyltransferase-1
VNEQYDEGQIIEQRTVQLDKDDKPDDIAAKIHRLEMEWYPVVIESVLNNL